MVDDHAGYKALFQHAHQHPAASEAMVRIGELYSIEAAARKLDSCASGVARKDAKPKLVALRDWLVAQRQRTAGNGTLTKAIKYSLKCWPALARYVGDDASRSTTAPLKTRFGRSAWVRRTGCLPAPNKPVSAPRPSRAC